MSTEPRKVTLPARNMDDSGLFTQEVGAWALSDKQLCGLVDRLRVMGYRRTLEVEFRFMTIGDGTGERGFTRFLPKFREKEATVITDTPDHDRIIHSSIQFITIEVE